MSLLAVAEAVDAGHVGTAFVRNNDKKLMVHQVPTACKNCNTPWPCKAVALARSK